MFKNTGNLPSQPALLKSGAVQNFKNPFFNNAPVGKIFATSALKLKPQILGPTRVTSRPLRRTPSSGSSRTSSHPTPSWKQFLKDVATST